jgi:hypothetical protein
VSLEIIHKPSIKPSPESLSIYVLGDPAPAQVPPPDPGAAALGLKEAAGERGRLDEGHGGCRLHARSPSRTIK